MPAEQYKEPTLGVKNGPWAALKAVEKKVKEAKAAPATFIRHRGYVAWDEPSNNVLDQKDSTFVVRPSQLGTGVHFQSVNFNNYYLRHQNFRLRISPINNKDLFLKDSTWIPKKVDC